MSGLKYKVGDEFTANMTFRIVGLDKYSRRYSVKIDIENNKDAFSSWFEEKEIDYLTPVPRKLQIGDEVKCRYQPSPATIVCIDGDDAWIKFSTGAKTATSLKDLKRFGQ